MPLLKENIMKLRRPVATLATAIALGSAAHADVTVTISATFDSQKMRQMYQSGPAQRRKEMISGGYGKPQTSTTYIHGGVIRRDEGGHSTIIDMTGHKALLLDNNMRMYVTGPFTPQPPPPQAEKPVVSVKDTGVTKQFLGHKVRVYKLSISSVKAKSSLTEEIWAAPDLPRAPYDPVLNNPASPVADKVSAIKGYPLKIVAHAVSPMDTNTVTETATAVSVKPLPASLFTVPSGYKKFTPPPPQQQPQQPSLVPQR